MEYNKLAYDSNSLIIQDQYLKKLYDQDINYDRNIDNNIEKNE